MSYIKFKNIDSRKFGIIPRLPVILTAEREIKTIDIPGRPEPIIQLEDTRKPLQIPITLGIPNLSRIREISAWLQGSGDLILSDDPNRKYHAYVTRGIETERLTKRFAKAPIIFTTSPFRYAVFNPFNEYEVNINENDLETDINIYCAGTADCEPTIMVRLAGKLKITVNGESFVVTAKKQLSNGVYEYVEQDICIDSSARQAYVVNEFGEKEIITNKTMGNFPIFRHEDNKIHLELISEVLLNHRRCTMFKCQNNERWY